MHAYDKEGNPRYKVIGKNGKERDTRITDVIQQGWYPSVTEVDSATSSKDWLTTWKINQAVEWCIANPFNIETYSVDEYLSLARDGSDKGSNKAIGFGTAIHDAIENYLLHRKLPDLEEDPWNLKEFFPPVREYLDKNIGEVVFSEACRTIPEFGIGGTIDLKCHHNTYGLILGDFKTQKVPRKVRASGDVNLVPRVDDKWIRQLALYAAMDQVYENKDVRTNLKHILSLEDIDPLTQTPCISIVIDSVEPGYIKEILWENENQVWGLKSALANIRAWCLSKRYNPPGCLLT